MNIYSVIIDILFSTTDQVAISMSYVKKDQKGRKRVRLRQPYRRTGRPTPLAICVTAVGGSGVPQHHSSGTTRLPHL